MYRLRIVRVNSRPAKTRRWFLAIFTQEDPRHWPKVSPPSSGQLQFTAEKNARLSVGLRLPFGLLKECNVRFYRADLRRVADRKIQRVFR